MPANSAGRKSVRYAIVGAGVHSRTMALWAFGQCRNSTLSAEVFARDSLDDIGEYEACLSSGLVDAVYLAGPLHRRKELVLRAAKAGVHVLCEKLLGLSTPDCEEMILACNRSKTKLMSSSGYYFNPASLKRMGKLRHIESIQAQPLKQSKIGALSIEQGGGPTYELGASAINMTRALFRDEPLSVSAHAVSGKGRAFRHFEETMNVVLTFPGYKMAVLTFSFGLAKADALRVYGTKGNLVVDPAFCLGGEPLLRTSRRFNISDSLCADLDHFSNCVITDKKIASIGSTGVEDVRIIEAIYMSVMTDQTIFLAPRAPADHARGAQEIPRPRHVA